MSGSPFADLRPPGAPRELRERVMAICRGGAFERRDPGLCDRLWASRAARRVWIAAVALLLAANLLTTRPLADPAGGEAPRAAAVAEGAAADPLPTASLWPSPRRAGWTSSGSRWARAALALEPAG